MSHLTSPYLPQTSSTTITSTLPNSNNSIISGHHIPPVSTAPPTATTLPGYPPGQGPAYPIGDPPNYHFPPHHLQQHPYHHHQDPPQMHHHLSGHPPPGHHIPGGPLQHPHPHPGIITPPPAVPYQPPGVLKLPTNSPISPGSAIPPSSGPIPHTPHGAPGPPIFPGVNGPVPHLHSQQQPPPPHVGSEHDLPPELHAIGWRKYWSKRENRWYFWNCNNNESMWELPPRPGGGPWPHQVVGHHPPGAHPPDHLTDPLGIQSANGPPAPLGLKRRGSSTEGIGGSPSIKKYILAGPWDLEVSSNVYTLNAPGLPQPHLLPPHPEIELLRYQLVVKLRQCYQTACQSRESIDAPKESLNRWFIERKVHDFKSDPIFPSCEGSEGSVSQVMLKEIMNDIPMKLIKPRFTGDARKQLTKYADACKRIIETRNASNEARKLVKWKVDETLTWLKLVVGSSFEALQERLNHLKETCQPHCHEAARSSVEGICKKISVLSKQYGVQIKEAHLKLFADAEAILNAPYEPPSIRSRCYPAICGSYHWTEAGKLPQIDFHQQDRDHVILKFKNDPTPIRITSQYLQKMEQLYRYNCVDDKKFEFFLARCYTLIKRYNAYTEDFSSPQSTQGSLPVTVFESIQRNFGVTFECFSSPFNCYFRQYCSAFPDTDGYFGSRGTFLEFKPIAGSFEVKPPFSEELIQASINHIEELLSGSKEPMSFIIFLPEYTEESKEPAVPIDLECGWIKRLENSRFKRKQVTIPAFEHEYRHGGLHNLPKSEVSIRSTHATVVFWLQNDAGFEEWKPTERKVDGLIDAYRTGRERERDRQHLLAPERQNPGTSISPVVVPTSSISPSISTVVPPPIP